MNESYRIKNKCKTIFSNIAQNISDKPAQTTNEIDTNFNHFRYNDQNRIERAFLFLQTLRSAILLPQKISLYIPIFECLFSIDNTEVAHKVSERTALYIGNDKSEKFDIFGCIKECYDLRSRYFHGSVLNKKYDTKEKQKKLAEKIDSICRRVLLKVIEHDQQKFLGKEEDLRAFFDSLIFN
jgi:hypothetical protein